MEFGRFPRVKKKRRGRPPGSTSDVTRTRILRAARACFALTGYAGTSNAQIGDRAGITAAAIYRYFPSKTALYMATVKDAQAELYPHFRDAAEGAGTVKEALREVLLASVRLNEEDPSLSSFLSALPVELRREPEVASAMAAEPSEIVALFDEIVSRGVKTGEVRREDADNVVTMIIACTMGFSLYAAAIDGAQLPGTVAAFVSLMDGTLLRAPRVKAARRG
jgi:AcrR family transcriptional regulator